MEITDDVVDHALRRGTPDQLLGDEALQRITGMTDEGIRAAEYGEKIADDSVFENAVDFLEKGMAVLMSEAAVLGDFDINYETLVRGAAKNVVQLGDVYKEVFLGCVLRHSIINNTCFRGREFYKDVVARVRELGGMH
jgi:hypothetical protein